VCNPSNFKGLLYCYFWVFSCIYCTGVQGSAIKGSRIMNKLWEQSKCLLLRAAKEPKIRKPVLRGLAVLLILQIYFVRELIVAEALFAIGFVVVMAIVGICYALGTVGLKGIDLTETGLRLAAQGARRSYDMLEIFARESVRHLPSETTK
jgi:hypothetical protein